jgi:hypothetical protein
MKTTNEKTVGLPIHFPFTQLINMRLPYPTAQEQSLPTVDDVVQEYEQGQERFAVGAVERTTQVGYVVEGFMLSMLGYMGKGNTLAAKVRAMRKQAMAKAKAPTKESNPLTKEHIEDIALFCMEQGMDKDADFCLWLAEGINS